MKKTKYCLCTEHGAADIDCKEDAIRRFKKLEYKKIEAVLYEGESILMRTEFTNNLV